VFTVGDGATNISLDELRPFVGWMLYLWPRCGVWSVVCYFVSVRWQQVFAPPFITSFG